MLQFSKWKVSIVALAAIFGILFTIPNLLPKPVLASLPSWVPAKTLNLGLDLQGGSSLLLEADTAGLKKTRLTNLVEDVRNDLTSVPIKFSNLGATPDTVTVTIDDPANVDDAFRRMQRLVQPSAGGVRDLSVERHGQQIVFTILPEAQKILAAQAVSQAREIVGRRIDALGTKEPSIETQGTDRILVEAPGEADPQKLKDIIGQTAQLSFQMVDDSQSPQEVAQGILPPGDELIPYEKGAPGQAELVKRRKLVTGDMITGATPEFDQNGQPAVGFRFNSIGARKFGEATTENIGKRFAIILDGKVISAPVIQTAITTGSGQITHMSSVEESTNLALLLRAGALPVKLNPIQQGTVGAELGADAVKAGEYSTVVGFAAIVVFMILSYGFLFGGVAVVALIVNLFMMIGFMSFTQGSLTLPGIAGLILTLAVAVDANVLIYERIRDEERSGHPPLMAIETGFKRAWVSIADANATSLISAAIMASMGSGPVKGFAVTLAIGVFTSVFTAMMVTQVLLGFWFRAVRPKTLPI
jgi:preprotein translocase subunit SecD